MPLGFSILFLFRELGLTKQFIYSAACLFDQWYQRFVMTCVLFQKNLPPIIHCIVILSLHLYFLWAFVWIKKQITNEHKKGEHTKRNSSDAEAQNGLVINPEHWLYWKMPECQLTKCKMPKSKPCRTSVKSQVPSKNANNVLWTPYLLLSILVHHHII